MSQQNPTAPPLEAGDNIHVAPPTYDEAVGNVPMASPKDQGVSNTAQDPVKKEEELKKKENQTTQAAPFNGPLITAQPTPMPQTTYTFQQPPVHHSPPVVVSSSNDCCLCCLWCNGEDIVDICYCIFCCARNMGGHHENCSCCECPDGCCDCGDCNCDCGDCDCGGGDCDCGGGDCNCDCGDCTIL